MDIYETLGLNKEASAAEIKAAYRSLSNKFHPDKSGQDTTVEFQEIKEAYEILKDPEKRKQYDATGSYTPRSSVDQEAMTSLLQVVKATMAEKQYELMDYVKLVRDRTKAGSHRITRMIYDANQQKAKIERLSTKVKGDAFQMVLEGELNQVNDSIQQLERSQVVTAKILELLEHCEYTGEDLLTYASGTGNVGGVIYHKIHDPFGFTT